MQPSHLSQSEALHSDLKAITEAHRAQVHLHTVHSPRHVATTIVLAGSSRGVHQARKGITAMGRARCLELTAAEEEGRRTDRRVGASEAKSRPNSWAARSSGSSSTWTSTMAS